MNIGRLGPTNLWGDRPPPAHGQTTSVDAGPLRLWLRGVENEIWVAHHSAEPGGYSPEMPPDDVEWSRWALRDVPHTLRIRPTFPDRPLVVKLEHPFTLLRQAEARVYMRVPAWACLEVVEGTKGATRLLCEIPTRQLSETWWGDFTEGELGYWLPTKGRRSLSPDLFETHFVMCALQLANLSADDLRVEKLALRVGHLSIYEKDGWLWAEQVRVHYHGEEEGSQIHMDDHAPAEADGAREISPARTRARSFRTRTFARLKVLSGLGG